MRRTSPGQPRRTSSPASGRYRHPSRRGRAARESAFGQQCQGCVPQAARVHRLHRPLAARQARRSDPLRGSQAPNRADADDAGRVLAGAVDAEGRNHTQPPTRRTAVCPYYGGVSAFKSRRLNTRSLRNGPKTRKAPLPGRLRRHRKYRGCGFATPDSCYWWKALFRD